VILRPISALAFLAPGTSTFFLNLRYPPQQGHFNMLPRKSQRRPKPITIWEEKKAPPAASDPKLGSETARNKPETALKPVAVEPLPAVDSE
jgi:Transposase IS4